MKLKSQGRKWAFTALDSPWKLRNRSKPRLFIFTDSRGLNLSAAKPGKIKHYYGSHVDWLQRRYRVKHVVCPFSHTTLIDFLNYSDGHRLSSFDAVILQCGVVDFSPRGRSNLEIVRKAKAGFPRFDEVFSANEEYYAAETGEPYEGEPTSSLYSQEYLLKVLEELRAIPNLIWVSSNRFVPGWDGNWKPRPSDIDAVVSSYDQVMAANIKHVVNLRDWTYDDVQRYTVDNIHFTPAGFKDVAGRLDRALSSLL